MINAGMLLTSSRRLIFGGPVIALGLTGKSLFDVKWELMKLTRRPSVSLVTETGLFLRMSSPLISGCPLLSLWCSAQVCHCLRLLMRVVDWCMSLLVRLICYGIILTGSNPGRLSICRSLTICLLVLPITCYPSPSLTTIAFRSREVRPLLVGLGPLWWHWPIGYVSSFS